MARVTAHDARKGRGETEQQRRARTFHEALAKAEAEGDAELVQSLTDLGRAHGWIAPPTGRDLMNEAIRAGARGASMPTSEHEGKPETIVARSERLAAERREAKS